MLMTTGIAQSNRLLQLDNALRISVATTFDIVARGNKINQSRVKSHISADAFAAQHVATVRVINGCTLGRTYDRKKSNNPKLVKRNLSRTAGKYTSRRLFVDENAKYKGPFTWKPREEQQHHKYRALPRDVQPSASMSESKLLPKLFPASSSSSRTFLAGSNSSESSPPVMYPAAGSHHVSKMPSTPSSPIGGR